MTSELVGEFFLTGPETLNQGQVIADLGDGYFLCQLYDWLIGHPSNRRIAHIAVMADWKFYNDADDWREAGKRAVPALRAT